MPLKFNSILRRADTMDPRRVDGIIKATIDLCVHTAEELVGGGDYIVRSLHRGDVPAVSATNRTWLETTGATTDQFITGAIGNGAAINDDTVIGIYGCRWVYSEVASFAANSTLARRPPVTTLRIVVGGTRVAEWDLYTIFAAAQMKGANSSIVTNDQGANFVVYPVGIAESPVLVKPRTTLLLQYNEVSTVAVDFCIQLLGVVCEKTGSGDGLNP
mgnify:CR=1 FL=1